ncbi:hypothetical protein FO519_010115 [Halicephalobus sp. NKZ332]|nr:hypothetical protein FO519_010115 [Halicephalobus sp. NKZ332]
MDFAQTGQSQDGYHGQTWIGLYTNNNPGRSFTWSDGTSVNYTNWTPGSPDDSSSDRCVVFAVDSYTCWGCDKYQYHYTNDPCGEVLRNFVCKKPASAANVVYAS